MPLDQLPTPTPPETTTCPPASSATLHAVFIADERGFTGARCVLPTGEAVEVHGRRTPFFAICRELDKRGYGDCRIEISTPAGTPSMRGKVSALAGLRIEESDQGGLRLRRFDHDPDHHHNRDRHCPYRRGGRAMTKAQHTPGTWTVHRFHTTGDADFKGIVTKSTRESEVGKWPRAVTGSP